MLTKIKSCISYSENEEIHDEALFTIPSTELY